MNVKNHNFSIRLGVSSRTTGKEKCGVAFLYSQLVTLGGLDRTHRGKQKTSERYPI